MALHPVALLSCLLLLAPPLEAGAFSSGAAGSAGANFLKLGTGARSLAMGGAATAAVNDPTALYWNPAALAALDQAGAALMFARHFESISYNDLAVSAPVPGAGTAALGVTTLDFGSIDGKDASGVPTSAFRPRAMVVSAGWASSFNAAGNTVRLGAAAKYVDFKIADRASGFAFDAGALYRASDALSLSFTVQNFGQRLKFDVRADELPLTLRAGAALGGVGPLLLAVDVSAARDNAPVAALGAEYAVTFEEAGRLLLRAGYSTRLKDVEGLAGPSFGFGFRRLAWSFDWSLVPMGDLGSTQQASFGYRWG